MSRLNKLVCLTCGYEVMLHPDHEDNYLAHNGIVCRAFCEQCNAAEEE
jgi:hypothetical protein